MTLRPGPPDDVLATITRWRPHAASWLGTSLLVDSVPIDSGRLTVNEAQEIPERLTLSVPEAAYGRVWRPSGPRHPLARYGQTLDTSIVTGSLVSGQEWTTRLGQFLVQESDYDDDAGRVEVEALGILQKVSTDRIPAPHSPPFGATLIGEFRRLTPGGIPVVVHPDVADRPCPTSFVWDDDRLKALYDIADALPALLRTSALGEIHLLPPLPTRPVPVLTIRDGEGGTLVSAPQTDSRDDVFNTIVVRSSGTDDPAKPPVWAEATVDSGPLHPATYGVVRKFFASPLVTNHLEALATARTMLAASVRRSNILVCSIAPDPRIDLDVPVEVWRRGQRYLGWVVAYSMPLTVKDKQMSVSVGVWDG